MAYKLRQLSVKASSLAERTHESEAIASMSYDIERQQCTVEFNERGAYTYFDMDPWTYSEFNNAGSRGTYFNLYIRGRFEYERIA